VSSTATSAASAPHLRASSELMLDAAGISVQFGTEQVLDNVSLCIHKGEFIGLIGPNGAGKTTLLRVMLGLLKPSSGTIKRSEAGKRIGYIPQRSAQYSAIVPISALEVVQLGARGDKVRALQALEAVSMQTKANQRFNELSGGQQQRISIAKALAGNAELLVLDEPTTGIDERSQAAFYELLDQLHQRGITIVIVLHEIETVLKLVTRVVCLNGTIIYDGSPEGFNAEKYLLQHKRLITRHHHHGDSHA
jgi:zinc transport system ATP-binding protein